jgi:hypothetical protein
LISGQVYCQDDGEDPIYIEGAIAQLEYASGGISGAVTNSGGSYDINSVAENQDFDLTVTRPTGTLPNGQPYAAMVGPTAVNCDPLDSSCQGNVTGDYCGPNGSYELCEITGTNNNNFDFRYTNCSPATEACIDLFTYDTDTTIAPGNSITYVLEYQSVPKFDSIRLAVENGGTQVGRDYNNQAEATVAPFVTVFDQEEGTWSYVFVWQATEVGGGTVGDGTYDVNVWTDGTQTSAVTDPTACIEQVTIASGNQDEPNFVVTKEGAEVCNEDGSATINYSLEVTNVGPVEGAVDSVTDTIDQSIINAGITPTNITPSFGQLSGNVITWTGTVSDRTFTAGQSKTYSYSITIPANALINFTTGVNNQAEVTFTTTEQNSFTTDVNTPLTCTIVIPATALDGDSARLILLGGLMFIAAVVVFRIGLGTKLVDTLIDKGVKASGMKSFESSVDDFVEEKISKKHK